MLLGTKVKINPKTQPTNQPQHKPSPDGAARHSRWHLRKPGFTQRYVNAYLMYIYVCLYNARESVFCGPARSRVVLNFLLLEREIEDPSNVVCYTGVMGLTNWCLAGSQQAVLGPLGTGKAGDIRLSVPALVAGLRGCSR